MWKAKWKALRSVILTVPIPRFCHILLQNMISLCAQIELNSWSVTCTPSNFPRVGKPRSEKFPAATTLSASLYLCCCFFFCFLFFGRCLFLLGYFPFGSFLNGSGYFQRAIVIFWVREIVRPSFSSPPFPFLHSPLSSLSPGESKRSEGPSKASSFLLALLAPSLSRHTLLSLSFYLSLHWEKF